MKALRLVLVAVILSLAPAAASAQNFLVNPCVGSDTCFGTGDARDAFIVTDGAKRIRVNFLGTQIDPLTDATISLGTSTRRFKDATLSGALVAGSITAPTFTGQALFADGTEAAPSIAFANKTDTGFWREGSGVVQFSSNGAATVKLSSDVGLGASGLLSWSGGASTASADLILVRDAANTLALRNGTNAQNFRVYNTFTSAAINERVEFAWGGNIAYVQTTHSGAVARPLVLRTAEAATLTLGTNSIDRWIVGTDGTLLGQTATGGLGYGTGAGGAVTQATSKSTGVTLNTVTGNITMEAGSLAANTAVSFTLTDSAIAATDLVVVTHHSGGTAGAYTVVGQAAAGSAVITLRNVTGGALAEAVVLKFAVIKGAVS